MSVDKKMGSIAKRVRKGARRAARKMAPEPVRKAVRARRKKLKEAREPQPNTYQGADCYTVVTAAYNVEKYIDDFFASLFKQTITKDCIRIVVVDDGSTDKTGDIVKEWQKKWPEGITYVRKENGGQAGARNVGLGCVQTEWVTFVDPDDFISKKYLENVDRVVCERPSLQMVCCNLIFYREGAKGNKYRNSHALRYRFAGGDAFFAVGDENLFPQLSASAAFFRKSAIDALALRFDEKVKPTFEDGHFAGRYIASLRSGTIGFLSEARYYYRKRADSSSTLDNCWASLDKVLAVPKYGYYDLLLCSEKACGHVPLNIQRTVLYDFSWYLKQYLDHPERSKWIADSEYQEEALSLWGDVFSKIDLAVIMDMPGSMLSYPHKYMTAGLFGYKEKLPYRISYVQRVDLAKRLICIEAYGDDISFYLDGEEVEPFEAKHVGHSFLGATLPSSRILWIPFEGRQQVLSFRSPQREPQRLSVRNKQLHESTTVGKLLDLYCKDWGTYEQSGDTWIIMDRDTQADDNGEHFCRYMIKEHPEQRVLFALRKEALQYEKLAREGFPLIEFGSKNYERELKACSKIISAHADAYVHSYFGDNFFQSKDFVFLQHGVTQNNISSWINPKPISLLVTATSSEYESISSDESPYKFGKNCVLLSGFARHDALFERAESGLVDESPCILVMPTWRNNLVGARVGEGNARSLSPLFVESAYKSSWEGFLWCDELRLLVDAGTRVVFFPHANMLPYVKEGMFSVPPYVEVGSCEGRSIQDYFCDADLCITDYTSAVFDVAYFGKPVIYYQFDQEEFFDGAHIFAKGYFDYERDGFGPVVTSQEDLVREMQRVAQNGYEPDEVYAQRMRDTFPFRDGKCCERIYEAIKKLDEPRG